MLTVKNDAEGFGAMYQGLIFGLAHCRKNNIKYLHTDLTTIHHGCKVKEANELIGFNRYEKANSNTPKLNYHPDIWGIQDVDSLITPEIVEEIRNNYNGFGALKETICIHIRRGDLRKNCKDHAGRWDDLSQYLPVIDYFKKNYNLPITICTQSKRHELGELLQHHSDLIINNDDTLETFKLMTNCRVLFIARSSYSYVAGILNRNTIYCDAIKKRWWHHSFNRWRTIDNFIF